MNKKELQEEVERLRGENAELRRMLTLALENQAGAIRPTPVTIQPSPCEPWPQWVSPFVYDTTAPSNWIHKTYRS